MKKTKFGSIGLIAIISSALFSAILFSVFNIHNAEAVLSRPTVEFVNDGGGGGGSTETASSSKDVDTIKQNILLKVYYSNLTTCYESMRSSIPMTTDLLASDYRYPAAGSDGGNYYFTSDAFYENYMLYPYGIYKDSRGNVVTSSSCVDMLSGWSSGHLWWKSTGTGILNYNRTASVPTYGGNNGEKIIEFLNNVGYDSSESDSPYANYECFYLSMNFSLAFSSMRQSYVDAGLSGARADRSVTFDTPDYCIVNKDKPFSATENQIVVLFGEWTQDYAPRTSEVSGHLKSNSNVVLAYLGSGSSPYLPSWQTATRYWANDGNDYSYETRFLEISNTNTLSLYYDPSLGKDSTTDVSSVSPNFIWTEEMCNNSKSYGFWACNYEKGAIVGPKNWRYSLTEPSETSISFTTFQERLKNYFANIQFDDDGGSPFFSNVTIHKHDPKDVEFTKRTNGVNDFIKYFLSDTSAYNGGKFTKSEQYILYHTFLSEYWDVDIKYAEPANSSEYFKIDNWLITNSSMEEYGNFVPVWVKPTTREGDDIRSLAGNLHWYSGASSSDFVQGDWRYIATLLNGINVETAFTDADVTDSIAGGDLDPNPSDGDDESISSGALSCFTEGSSLGWILCPTIEVIGSAASGLYDWVVDSWISVGESEMLADESNGVYIGWKSFRDIANTIFVIMLIIVIFSQVTGFGLTNYGIKKTLPTLIMVAILVNLSFIICQLAVDVTNIIGDGMLQLFRSFPVTNSASVGGLVTAISTIITLGAVGGVAAGGIMIYGVNGFFAAMLIPALLGLITILLSILFFFIVLAVRKVGIFILIVLSPVAIILYALPNTKNLFQKWIKLFTSLLLVYPICGMLMGGGEFFSGILLGSSASVNFFVALVAALLQVVPFFMIPSIVRGSLVLAGNIGNKIGQLGSRLTRTAQGTLSHSRWAQDRQQRLARNANIRRDTRLASRGQKLLNALDAKRDENGELSKRNQRRYRRAEYETARAAARFRKSAAEDAQATVESRRGLPTSGSMQYTNMMDAYENAAREREVNEWQASMLNGHMQYTTGTGANAQEIDVDVNNLGKINTEGNLENTPNAEHSLSAALLHHLNAYDNAADKNSEAAKLDLLKAQAIASRLLDAGGDNGQTIVTNALRGRTFGTNGVAKNRNDIQSVSRLSEYIARNGKWMGQIKKTDVGSFSFLNDTANKTADIKDRAFYHTTGDKKITAANIPGLSDGFFEGIVHEINQGTYNDENSDAAKRLLEIDAAATRAMADERIASEIKPETREQLNRIHEMAYKIQQKQWFNGSTNGIANASQFKGYDSTGAQVQATGMDDDGYLVRQAANGVQERLLSSVGGVPIVADRLYQQHIRRYQDLMAGQSQEELKILRKRDLPAGWKYDSQKKEWGRMVPISVNPNTHIITPEHWEALSPEEAAKARQITEYNASVDIQNQQNQQNRQNQP